MAFSPIYMGKVIVPEMFKVKSPDFHYEIEKGLLDLKSDAQNYVAPRGHAKSSIVACLGPIWHIFFEDYYRYLTGQLTDDPLDKRLLHQFKMFEAGKIRFLPFRPKLVLLISKTASEAINRLDTIKTILGDAMQGEPSKMLRAICGDFSQDSAVKWTGKEITIRDGTTLVAIGTAQQARGKKKVHLRPTFVVVDDPEDEENTRTPERMLANINWLEQAIMPSVDVKRGRTICIGTPQNEGCMVVTLAKSPRWKTVWFENDLASGEVLWPWYITEDKLRKEYQHLKEQGRLGSYYREWEAKVVGSENQLIKNEYFKFWTGELKYDVQGEPYLRVTSLMDVDNLGKVIAVKDYSHKPLLIPVTITIGIDPASAISSVADYSCIMVLGIGPDRKRYGIDMFRARRTPHQVADVIVTMMKRYKPTRAYIETTGYQEMLRETVKLRMDDEGINVIGLESKNNPRTSKSDRLSGLEPEFARGDVFVHANGINEDDQMPDTIFQPFIDEATLYPHSKHDDTLDAYWYARKRVLPAIHDVVLERKETKVGYPIVDWMLV